MIGQNHEAGKQRRSCCTEAVAGDNARLLGERVLQPHPELGEARKKSRIVFERIGGTFTVVNKIGQRRRSPKNQGGYWTKIFDSKRNTIIRQFSLIPLARARIDRWAQLRDITIGCHGWELPCP